MRLPRDRTRRRRLLALAAVAAIAAIAGLAVGATRDGGSDRVDPASDRPAALDLPLERQVGELLVMSFEGTEPPEYIRRRLRNGEGAGVILFGGNVTDASGLRRLTRSVQRAAGGDALIAVDQEGGEIRNVPFAGPVPGQGALGTVEEVREEARAGARDLQRAGVNVNLAPVADVGGSGALAGRMYPGSAETVARLVVASVGAQRDEGVAATVKHYPGLGRAAINTDDGSAAIDASLAELEATDLAPFRAAAEADAPLVMVGHALYPAIDARRIASQSPLLLGEILRERLRYRGVVVTDSIEAQAVLDRSDVATAAVRSIRAGADLVLMTGSGSWNLVYPRLLAAARRSPALRRRIEESAQRVRALRRSLGRIQGRAGRRPRT